MNNSERNNSNSQNNQKKKKKFYYRNKNKTTNKQNVKEQNVKEQDVKDIYVKKVITLPVEQNPKIEKLLDQLFITSIRPEVQVINEAPNLEFKPDIFKKIDVIDKSVNSIDDLIEIGKLYELDDFKDKNYSINVKGIHDMQTALLELQSLVGLQSIKNDIIEFIMFFSQTLHEKVEYKNINKQQNSQTQTGGIFQLLSNSMPPMTTPQVSAENKHNKTDDLLKNDSLTDLKHIVIVGPPGCGKTILARIIAKICLYLGISKNDTFKVVKRQDLIGEYLGHTAIKTQKVIDEAYGGVLFIDEAYSLGNRDKSTDSFSKECIDTINQNLTERKGEFICIIAGYEEELENNFFSINPGLKRRFPFVYKISKYTSLELLDILLLKIKLIEWVIKKDTEEWLKKKDFFKDKLDKFPCFAGDVEIFLFNVKIEHSKRIFGKHLYLHKVITKDDINKGYTRYLLHKDAQSIKSTSHQSMYI